MFADSDLPQTRVHGKSEADFGVEQNRSVDYGEKAVGTGCLCVHISGETIVIREIFVDWSEECRELNQQVLEQVNAVMGNLFATDVMSKETLVDTVN